MHDERAVGIEHIQFRADMILARIGFTQVVARGNLAILREPAARAPAAMRQPELDRRIERAAVDAGLAA
jgi:hypothetical protein